MFAVCGVCQGTPGPFSILHSSLPFPPLHRGSGTNFKWALLCCSATVLSFPSAILFHATGAKIPDPSPSLPLHFLSPVCGGVSGLLGFDEGALWESWDGVADHSLTLGPLLPLALGMDLSAFLKWLPSEAENLAWEQLWKKQVRLINRLSLPPWVSYTNCRT